MWVVYAILSAVFAALVSIFAKIGLKDVDTTLATAVRAVVMALFLVGVVLFTGKINMIGDIFGLSRTWVFILLSGIAGALSWLFYFIAIRDGSVSPVVALDRTSVVFAIIFAALFLGETLTIKSVIGALLVLGGAILIAL
ncbi:EamA family transporter [Candidatus Nomurabacteria bacterium]|nr:EamA family transporter [Candidatus Nomurabacteria bacterium]USN94995.1 MAG: EamA family transporter [Candidatus Nomurabacteria bacterium]